MEARTTMLRKMVRIDEERCNGCGQCALACAEGAIEIVEGKARLVSESYCDGLGACIGECPQGAITVEEREAEAFDPEAVEEHLARRREQAATLACGCPGSMARSLTREAEECCEAAGAATARSRLSNWPVQLRLVPPTAPYLEGARLLVSADCVPFALGDFHRRLLPGRVLLVGCPKLDDAEFYVSKLAAMLKANDIESVEVAYMEVPCCAGLVRIVEAARREAGKEIPVKLTKIAIGGEVCEEREAAGARSG